MDKKVKDISFRIGMNLHKIAMSVPDSTLRRIKPYMDELEDKVNELIDLIDLIDKEGDNK